MVCYDLDLRTHTVLLNSIGPPRCDPWLRLHGASFIDHLPFLTCADLLFAWQECVLLPIQTLILIADILQLRGQLVRILCPSPDPIPMLRM